VVSFDYTVISVNETMLNNIDSVKPLGIQKPSAAYSTALSMQGLALEKKLDRLENAACISAYATPFQTTRTHLLLVYEDGADLPGPITYDTEQAVFTPMMLACQPDPYYWVCGNKQPLCPSDFTPCSVKVKDIAPTEWTPMKEKVSYCLSAPAEQHCKLQFSPQIAWTVVAFNLIKVIVLIFVALGIRESPLLTIGDALASFLTYADETTKGICLMGKKNITWWYRGNQMASVLSPQPFDGTRQRWMSAVSVRRWVTCMSL
jgi:hypothetical protein